MFFNQRKISSIKPKNSFKCFLFNFTIYFFFLFLHSSFFSFLFVSLIFSVPFSKFIVILLVLNFILLQIGHSSIHEYRILLIRLKFSGQSLMNPRSFYVFTLFACSISADNLYLIRLNG